MRLIIVSNNKKCCILISSCVLVQLSAIDLDTGPAGEVTYSIVRGNEAGAFRLDPADGWLSVVQKTLRYNPNVPKLTPVVEAVDGQYTFSLLFVCKN